MYTALHFAMLHKLFTVVKFLVEDCKVDVNCICHGVIDGTPLHMAYGIGEETIAQYLIKHGANQDTLDSCGLRPENYKVFAHSKNMYATASQSYMKLRVLKRDPFSDEHLYFQRLRHQQGIKEIEAVELTFKQFPSLEKYLDGDIPNPLKLKLHPTPRELNHYITDMAPSHHEIGLELGIRYAKLKVIKIDSANLEEKTRKMLQVWLETDTSASWKKLCHALQEVEMNVLAEQIKKSL